MPILLQINVTANWGSTGKIAEQIGLVAQEHGWDSYIAYGRHMNLSRNKLIKIGSMLDVYEHYIENRLFDNEGRASRGATVQLIKIIKKLHPDVIHLHNIHDHYLNFQKLFEYLNQTNIKVVWTFHDCWAFTGYCYHFVQENCTKWQSVCGNCVKRNKILDRSRENFLLKKSLFTKNKNIVIIPCSEWMGNLVKESFFKEKQIQVIHNGIDLNTFIVLPEVKRHNQSFRIIAVSNVWMQYKGLFDIFKLREMLPEDYEITIVGLTEKQLKTLPNGICGIKRTQNVHELVRLYNQADILINPTYSDTFPTVNLEALACGIPVITYQTGGSSEAIDEKTGVVVPQGNVQSMFDAIKKMRDNPLSRKDCRKRAEIYFEKGRCFKKYIQLYNNLLEN